MLQDLYKGADLILSGGAGTARHRCVRPGKAHCKARIRACGNQAAVGIRREEAAAASREMGLRPQYGVSDHVRCQWQRLLRIPLMDAYELLKSHRYADSIREYRRQLELNPDDWAAIAGLIKPLMAVGAHAETLPLLYRLDEHERESLPGHPGRKRDLACSYWCLDQWPTAMKLMRGLVEGI